MKKRENRRKIQIVGVLVCMVLALAAAAITDMPVYAIAGTGTFGVPCPSCGSTNCDGDVVAQATCTSAEQTAYTCYNPDCRYCYKTQYVTTKGALGHQYTTTSEKAATCTAAGTRTMVCARCQNQTTQTIAALGHNYQRQVTTEATCTKEGAETYTCSRCRDSYNKTIAALGHDYEVKTTEPTCTEDGEEISTCKRCKDEKKEKLDALGHDYESEKISDATCTEDGVTVFTCKRCEDTYEEIEEAFGHLYIYEVTKEPTCTEDGERIGRCTRCEDENIEAIDPKGHTYPEDWETKTNAGWFSDGEESHSCTICGTEESRIIPRTMDAGQTAGAAAAAAAALGAIGYGIWKLLQGRKALQAAETAAKGLKGVGYTLDNRKIVMCLDENDYNRSLIDTFLGKPYLKITETKWEELDSTVERIEPDLTVLGVETMEDLQTIESRIETMKEAGKAGDEAEKDDDETGGTIALIVEPSVMEKGQEILEAMKEKGVIDTYMDKMRSTLIVLVHLVLPMYKPDLKSDEGLALIGSVGDALGIPGVSLLMNIILTKHDIDDRKGNDDRALSENAAIIGDIAAILGLDMVENIASYVMQEDIIKDTAAIHRRKAAERQAKADENPDEAGNER